MSPKLNLGSGCMLLQDYINFDAVEIVRGDTKTDVIGRIENVTEIFPSDSLDRILTSHVAEHFYPEDWKKVLRDCYSLLASGGEIIVECPDVVGIISLWQEKHHVLATVPQLVSMLYGTGQHQWAEQGWHKWGYSQDTMAEVMEECGFEIVYRGIGRTHGMGRRDLRIEGRAT